MAGCIRSLWVSGRWDSESRRWGGGVGTPVFGMVHGFEGEEGGSAKVLLRMARRDSWRCAGVSGKVSRVDCGALGRVCSGRIAFGGDQGVGVLSARYEGVI